MKELFTLYTEQKFSIFVIENGTTRKMHGKENRFLTKTDAENTIRTIVKQNPKLYKFVEK